MMGAGQTNEPACSFSNPVPSRISLISLSFHIFALCCFSLSYDASVFNTDEVLLCCVFILRLTFPRGHFPRLAECAHFHYETVDFGNVQVRPKIRTLCVLQQRVAMFSNCVFGSSSVALFDEFLHKCISLEMRCGSPINTLICPLQRVPPSFLHFLLFPEMSH